MAVLIEHRPQQAPQFTVASGLTLELSAISTEKAHHDALGKSRYGLGSVQGKSYCRSRTYLATAVTDALQLPVG
jgi:hypothetical protein